MLTTIRALCGSQNMPTTSLPSPCSPSQTHSLPIIPRLFARGFPLCLFYLCSHSMTPVPPVSCCLTYPPTLTDRHTQPLTPLSASPNGTHILSMPLLARKNLFLSFYSRLCVAKYIADYLIILAAFLNSRI